MTIKTQEHSDVMAQFERESKGMRLDRELKDYWPLGRVYQDGHVNEVFLAYRRGYALAKAIYQVGSGTEPVGEASGSAGRSAAPSSTPSTSPTTSLISSSAVLHHPECHFGRDAECDCAAYRSSQAGSGTP